ncbi:MAG: endonuclease domain-containing protein [Chloroflexi bacterium]|nr:endonuclease domain-containing protein [Chloroflexota bacterium]
MLLYNKNLKQLSRQLRGDMTDAERRLWTKIRLKQLRGFQFYRQKPIGDYIVDFFCPRAKLVVEVDGSQHSSSDTVEYDRIRDEYMNGLGLRVLRFTNIEVLQHVEGVVESIEKEIPEEIPLSPPFVKGETQVSASRQKGKPSPFSQRGRHR